MKTKDTIHIDLKCSNGESCPNGRPRLFVPKRIIDAEGKVIRKYRAQVFESFATSACGGVYCCLACRNRYTDD